MFRSCWVIAVIAGVLFPGSSLAYLSSSQAKLSFVANRSKCATTSTQLQAIWADSRGSSGDQTSNRGRKRRWLRRLLQRKPTNSNNLRLETTSSSSNVQVDLPLWAISCRDEMKRLAATKALLQDDFMKLQKQTVELDGATVSVQEAFPDVYGDLRLLRFLRKDKVQDPVSASNRYRTFLEWRQASGIDQIRAQVEQQQEDRPNSLLISDHIPCDFMTLDRAPTKAYGSFPIVLHVGEWKTHTIADLISQGKLGLQDFLEHWTFMLESLHRDLYRESYRKGRLVYVDEICDLQDLSLRQFSPTFVARVLEPWVSLSQRYYPETTKRIVFLNPPRLLTIVWNIVARFVSPGTKAKVKVTGFNGSSWDFVKQLYN